MCFHVIWGIGSVGIRYSDIITAFDVPGIHMLDIRMLEMSAAKCRWLVSLAGKTKDWEKSVNEGERKMHGCKRADV